MFSRFDHDKAAMAIRAALAVNMRSQQEVARTTGIPPNTLNAFLRRRINLVDADILRLLKELRIDEKKALMAKLSVPAQILERQ